MRNHPKVRSPANPLRPQAAYTLVELLVSLTVAGVLLALSVPSLNQMLQTQKSISLLNSFVASLHLARGEAIKRNARAVMCKSANGLSCSSDGGWEQGWILFHDANNNAAFDEGEAVVLQQGALAQGQRLTGNFQVANYVSYSASGSAKLISGAWQAGTFTLCPPVLSSVEVRQIILSGTGRPRTQKASASVCV